MATTRDQLIETAASIAPGALYSNAKKFLLAGDWQGFLWTCNKTDRWYALNELQLLAEYRELQSLFASVWNELHLDRRVPNDELADWIDGYFPEYKALAFTPEDVKVIDALPKCFCIYRGCAEGFEMGRSWTLSRKVAEFFATRFWIEGTTLPSIIMSRVVSKRDVLFYTNVNGEQEIVLRQQTDSKRRRVLSSREIRRIKLEKSLSTPQARL
jgi:hypothetical protein